MAARRPLPSPNLQDAAVCGRFGLPPAAGTDAAPLLAQADADPDTSAWLALGAVRGWWVGHKSLQRRPPCIQPPH